MGGACLGFSQVPARECNALTSVHWRHTIPVVAVTPFFGQHWEARMIRFIQCVRRKSGLSVDEFRRQWDDYQQAYRDLALSSGARRIAVSFGLTIPYNHAIQETRGTLDPFDAVLEVWWQSGAAIAAIENRPDIQHAIRAIQELQPEFMDLQGSSFFFASEEIDETLS